MILHQDPSAFKELVEFTAAHFGYEQSHVEKDYWVCKFLQEISDSEFKDKVYFKGGTSLSKGYELISRFSEDLDLFVFTGNTSSSKQAEKTLNKRLSKFVIEQNQSIYRDDLSQIGGNFRKLYFSYDNFFQCEGLKEYLEVEIKSCDLPNKELMYYPSDLKPIQPYITAFLISQKRNDLIDRFVINPFEVKCINPRKTICDKISRLVKLSYSQDLEEQIAKYIRDVYDLTQLLSNAEFNSFVCSQDFKVAMKRVAIEDDLYNDSKSHLSFSNAIIFRDAKSVMNFPKVLTAFSIDLRKLSFDKTTLPSIDDAVTSLKLIHSVLTDFDSCR